MPSKSKTNKIPASAGEGSKDKGGFSESMLSDSEKINFQFVKNRILELNDVRANHYGLDLDTLWSEADTAYIPHRLNTKGSRKVIATDEKKGWRGKVVTLDDKDWQSDVSQPNVYTKIGTALAILIDQNPSGVFTPLAKKYESVTYLMKQLYERSWEISRGKGQLKLFVHNLAKYGFAAARTYPLLLKRNVKVLRKYDPLDPSKNEYEEREVIEYNDIFRENLDPRNVWVDDMARPNNTFSTRDWAWRKVYTMDSAQEEFGKYVNWKYVKPGGVTSETITHNSAKDKTVRDTNLVEVYFYENKIKDLFYVIVNGVPVVMEPLPIANSSGVKKLSLWHTYWTLRHAESIYGIGIYEAMRFDQGLLDRIRNMTVDQLTLAIYKMFFYQGTQVLTDTGDITITPGKGKQVLDPKSVTWLQVPGPGREAWEGLAYFRKGVDESSGINDTLAGEITGKTAFEIAQAKEAALKRMKVPLDNILDALNEEGYITLSLIQTLYSIPETYAISDPNLIDSYLNEIQSDPELYERNEDNVFIAKIFREFPLNVDKDEKGNLIETEATQFFRVKPKYLPWEGIINIKAQSMLTPSKQIDKALETEMWNILIPLFVQPPELYLKTAKAIAKLYDKDPKDIIPDSWLNPPELEEQPLFIDENNPPEQGGTTPAVQPGRAEKFVGNVQMPTRTSIAGSISNRIKSSSR